MSSTIDLHRYLLPDYPFFFILAARAMRENFKPGRLAVAALALVLLVFAGSWAGWRLGGDLASPSSLAYMDFVRAHQEAASFIEERYPDKVVLAGWPQYIELTVPSMGYVRQPVKTVAYALPFRFAQPRMIALGARYFTDLQTLTSDDFDLVFFSDHTGHADAPIVRNVIERFRLPVVAYFRVNAERATIYGNPRRIKLPAQATE